MCKRVLGIISLGIFLLAVLGGCAATNSERAQDQDGIPVGKKFFPKLPAGIVDVAAAKKDLADLLNSRKQPGIRYHGQSGIDTYAERSGLAALVQGRKGGVWAFYNSGNNLLFMGFDGLSVREESIEVSPRMAFFFNDLADTPIVVEKIAAIEPALIFQLLEGGPNMANLTLSYEVDFPGLMSFRFAELPDAQRFADDLFFIQQNMTKYNSERLALFEFKAAQYRALKVKPPISEAQRRYIVQANALNERKDYAGAIDMYIKAVEVDPVSYPAAYFNLALLSAQMNRFKPAIAFMKQYLLLEPEAKDSRSGQDKIYEWELMIRK